MSNERTEIIMESVEPVKSVATPALSRPETFAEKVSKGLDAFTKLD